MKSVTLSILALLLSVVPAVAQDVDATSIYLGAAPCRILSGSGSPEGAVTAEPCSLYLRTSDGQIWRKASGSSSSGWAQVSFSDPLGVARGGTGASTLATNGVLYGNGTSAVGVTAAPGANSVLAGNSSTPSFTSSPTVTSVTATTSVTTPVIASGGDITLNPAGADVLPNAGYTVNLGSLSAKYLTLHVAELWSSTLVAQDTLATIGGRVLVAPTTQLAADLSDSATSISVKHNSIARHL